MLKGKLLVVPTLLINSLGILSTGVYADENNILINEGARSAIKIGIANFGYSDANASKINVEQIIGSDLRNSGLFIPLYGNSLPQEINNGINPKAWTSAGVNYLVTGQVTTISGGRYRLEYKLFDMAGVLCEVGTACISKQVDYSPNQNRDLGHTAANDVYEAITKNPGDFLSKIAYVQQPIAGVNEYNLYIADYDGYNAKRIYSSKKPLMSPSWSADNRKIAFVTYSTFAAEILQVDVATNNVITLVNKLGNAGSPAFSPNGNYLAYSFGNNGSSDVFLRNLSNGQETNLTKGQGRNTEPSWYGNTLIFTSDRGGTAAIYQLDPFTGAAATKVSRTSGQTTNAEVSYAAQTMVMINKDRLTTQALVSGNTQNIVNTYLDESPSLSSNGYMILYSSTVGNNKVINLTSIDGFYRVTLPFNKGSYSYPAWSKQVKTPSVNSSTLR